MEPSEDLPQGCRDSQDADNLIVSLIAGDQAVTEQQFHAVELQKKKHRALLDFIQAYRSLYGSYPPSVLLPEELAATEPEMLYFMEEAERVAAGLFTVSFVASKHEPARIALLRSSL